MILFVSLAMAAPAYDDLGFLLSPPATGPFAGGIGAPTVEWDGAARQFVMFFESPAVAADIPADCVSYYRIGRATSPDGQTWTIDETAVLEPDHVDPLGVRRCAVSQPAVVFDGETWHMLFSQASTKDTDTRNAPAGIGYARSADGLAWTAEATPAVTPDSNGIGLASATVLDGTLYVLYSVSPHLYLATRPVSGGAWNPHGTPVLENSVVGDWAATWVFGASLTCDESAGNPFLLTFGGDDAAVARSLGVASSPDAQSWAIDAGSPLSGGTLDYGALNHWDVLAVGPDAWALWYSKTDTSTGLKAIGAAISGTPNGENHGRTCPDPWEVHEDTGDSGNPDTGRDSGSDDSGADDSGASHDTGNADTGGKGNGGDECGCNAGGAGAGIAVVGLALGAVRRRPGRRLA